MLLRNASRLSARLLQLRFKFNLYPSPARHCALTIQTLWSGNKQESKLQHAERKRSQNTWHQQEPKRPGYQTTSFVCAQAPPYPNALLKDSWEGRYANSHSTPPPFPCDPCQFHLAPPSQEAAQQLHWALASFIFKPLSRTQGCCSVPQATEHTFQPQPQISSPFPPEEQSDTQTLTQGQDRQTSIHCEIHSSCRLPPFSRETAERTGVGRGRLTHLLATWSHGKPWGRHQQDEKLASERVRERESLNNTC